MADLDNKKVVNIGWLKGQGYIIKEAYTDNSWCPTYNNITAGTIGNGMGVSGTCYGTGKAYSLTQLVCVKDIYPTGNCPCANEYGTVTVTQTTGGLTRIPASGGTYFFSSSSVPYSAYTSTPVAGGCSPCTYSSSAYTSFTTSAVAVAANLSTSSKVIEGTSNYIHYQITQEAHEGCSCENKYDTVTVTQTTTGLNEIPASGGTYYFTSSSVPYSAYTSTPTATGCSDCAYSSSAYTSFTTSAVAVAANLSTSSKVIEGTSNYIHYQITQKAHEGCSCEVEYGIATVTQTTTGLNEIPASGGTYYFSSSTVPYSAYTSTPTAQGCSECEYSSSAYTSFTTSAIVVPANTSSSSKPIEGTSNYIHYVLNQAAGCTCDSLSVTGYTSGSSAQSGAILGKYVGDCLTNVQVSEYPDVAWVNSVGLSGKNITGNVEENSSMNYRDVTIRVTANECDGKTFYFRQDGRGCSRDDLTINVSSLEWNYNATASNTKEIIVTSASCITNITVASTTHFTATKGSGKIIVAPKESNTGTTDYVDTLTISYTAGTTPWTRTVTLTQHSSTCPVTSCTCYTVGSATANPVAATATTTTVTWSYTATTWTRGLDCNWTITSTASSTASTAVTFAANTTCGSIVRSGTFTWTNHTVCGTDGCGDSDVEVNWSVSQNGKVVTCDDMTVSGSSGNSSAHNNFVLGNYGGDCFTNVQVTKPSSATWITSISLNGNNIIGNVTANDDLNDRTTAITVKADQCSGKAFTFKQEGRDCASKDLTLSTASQVWVYNSTASTDITITSASCINTIALSGSMTHFTATLGSGKVTVKPKDINSSADDYIETFNVTYKAGSTSYSSAVTLTQNSSNCTTAQCECYLVGNATGNAVAATATTGTVSWSYSAITWTRNLDCTMTSAKTEGTSSTTVSFAANTSCGDVIRDGDIIWTNHKACGVSSCTDNNVSVHWSVTQNGRAVGCNNLSAATGSDGAASGGSFTLGTFSADTCLTGLQVTKPSSATWITSISLNGNNVIGNVTANNDLTDRTALITIKADQCTSGKSFTYKQKGRDCACGDLTASTTSLNWDYSATTSSTKDITITSASCISNVTAASTTHFKVTKGSGKITVAPKQINDTGAALVDTLTISYTAGTTPCSSAVTLTQYKAPCTVTSCTCYTVSNATGSLVAATATTTTVTWSYTATTWTRGLDCNWTITNTQQSSSSTTVSFPANTTYNQVTREGDITWANHPVCESTGCGSINVTIHWSVPQSAHEVCTCSNTYGTATVTQTTGGLTTLPAAGGTYYFSSSTVPYSAYTSTPTAEGCTPCAFQSTAYTSFTTSAVVVGTNTSTASTTVRGTNNHIYYVIPQSGRDLDPCPSMTQYSTEIAAEGSSDGVIVAYWTHGRDYPLNTFSETHTGSSVTGVVFTSSTINGTSYDVVKVKCSSNSSTSPINIKIVVKTSVKSSCEWTFNLTQAGTSPSCDCTNVTWGGTQEADPT